MPHTSGGFLVLLLVVVILFMPVRCSTEKSYITESPLVTCGDSASQQETLDDCESENDDCSKFITVVIVVLIIIFIIYCFSNSSG